MTEFRWETVLHEGAKDLYVDGVKRGRVWLDTGRWAHVGGPWKYEVEYLHHPDGCESISGGGDSIREVMALAEEDVREDIENGRIRDARKAREAAMPKDGFYRREDGKIAVLESGTRWYPWFGQCTEGTGFPYVPAALFDPEVVSAVLDNDLDWARQIAEEKWPEGDWSRLKKLDIEWVDEGSIIHVEYNEDDGHEHIYGVLPSRPYERPVAGQPGYVATVREHVVPSAREFEAIVFGLVRDILQGVTTREGWRGEGRGHPADVERELRKAKRQTVRERLAPLLGVQTEGK